jgi:hypothetical protein
MSEDKKAPPKAEAKPVPAPAPAPADAAQPAKRPKVMFNATGSNKILPAPEGWATWQVVAPAQHSIEDAEQPDYLWRYHEKMRPGDFVMIRHELHAFLLEYIICAIDKDVQCLVYKTLRKVDLLAIEAVTKDLRNAFVAEIGPTNWAIKIDALTFRPAFKTREQAQAWLEKRQAADRAARGE